MELLAFHPHYRERVWGGRRLEETLARELPPDKPIGESWEIVDRPEVCSVVASGPHAGTSLRSLLRDHGDAILGPGRSGDRPFPLLIKWLDCRERLSLQVHPPAAIAPALGGEPKTENWYIAAADPGAALLLGLKKGVTRAQFGQALKKNEAESCVHRLPVQAGDSVLVESGRMHAIDAGNLILEIQQNSDTTYRVYDWGRVGLDGNPRELHIGASLRSIDFDDIEPSATPARPGTQTLAEADEFRIRKFDLEPGGDPLHLPANEEPRLLHVVRGSLRETRSGNGLPYGGNYLQPFATECRIAAPEPATLLVTDRFLPPAATENR